LRCTPSSFQEFELKHLGVRDERIRAAVPDGHRLVDEVVGLGGLLGDGVDSGLDDLAFSASNARRLDGSRRLREFVTGSYTRRCVSNEFGR
jgi:hypothetical protein